MNQRLFLLSNSTIPGTGYLEWAKDHIKDYFKMKNIILMGVGWWQYQSKPNLYTKILLNKVFHSQMLHSVRDNYTKIMLESAGITNVINTGCPTLWNLTPEHVSQIPREKSESVVMTVTAYKPNKVEDKKLFQILILVAINLL